MAVGRGDYIGKTDKTGMVLECSRRDGSGLKTATFKEFIQYRMVQLLGFFRENMEQIQIFRERTKVFRSLDSSVGAQEFVAGMQVFYNYLRPQRG
jgi:hypothetical protein